MVSGTVGCLYCRKKIGPLRRLRDQHFCCADHRRKMESKSARAMRDAEDLYGLDRSRSLTWRAVTKVNPEEKEERRPGFGMTIFVSLSVVFLMLAISQLPTGGAATKSVSTLPDTGPQPSKHGFGQMVGSLMQSKASSTLRDDFHTGFGNWEGHSAGLDWGSDHGHVRPASLRIWTPTASLSNYQLEFMGQIDRKSMDWAFRASDTKNYYATKLVMTRPGPLPNADLVRFIVLDGRERERVELPLPLTLERGVDYRVRVNVQGSRFLTSVNGQVVSSWNDARLSRGGVGFFSDEGESDLLKWVSVSERDSFLARIVSHFSLITFPTTAIAGIQ